MTLTATWSAGAAVQWRSAPGYLAFVRGRCLDVSLAPVGAGVLVSVTGYSRVERGTHLARENRRRFDRDDRGVERGGCGERLAIVRHAEPVTPTFREVERSQD
jgi:hypothetical protein